MSLFPEPPPAGDVVHHQLLEITFTGPLDGPSYGYRGAVIDCLKGGHVCRLTMPSHPLHGHSFGVVGTITSLVDLWADTGRLPRYKRARPRHPA